MWCQHQLQESSCTPSAPSDDCGFGCRNQLLRATAPCLHRRSAKSRPGHATPVSLLEKTGRALRANSAGNASTLPARSKEGGGRLKHPHQAMHDLKKLTQTNHANNILIPKTLTDVLPSYVGHLHHSLTQGTGVAHAQRGLEVVLRVWACLYACLNTDV
jgi:hypothetical protein